MEVEILKESLDAAHAKKPTLPLGIVERGCFPMSTVAKMLGVARSNLIQRQNRAIAPRGRYRMVKDADLLPLIRASVDERPTYGYRRVAR
jgi:hypothetical protein